ASRSPISSSSSPRWLSTICGRYDRRAEPGTLRRGRIPPPPAEPRQPHGVDPRCAGAALLLHHHGANGGLMSSDAIRSRNLRTAGLAALLAVAMVGLGFAAVPLYNLFCRVTGFGGTTQRYDPVAAAEQPKVLSDTISVRFDANVSPK